MNIEHNKKEFLKLLNDIKKDYRESNPLIKDVEIIENENLTALYNYNENNLIELLKNINLKIIKYNIFDMLIFSVGDRVKIKDLKDGKTKILNSGSKTYLKNIKSNLLHEDYIILNNMSCDVTYIKKEDKENYFIGKGSYMIRLKEEFKKVLNLKFLYYLIQCAYLESIKNLRHGACQQFISLESFKNFLKSQYIKM